jgi:hypothetical protein
MGQEISADANFNVFRPAVEFTADTTDVNLVANGQAVQFGDTFSNPSKNGIVFHLSFGVDENGVPRLAPETGEFVMTQLVQSTMLRQRPGIPYREILVGAGVDGQFSYHPSIWRDSPISPLPADWEWYSRADDFRTYLMFNPGRGKSSIFVPMQLIEWSWSAELLNDNGWQLIETGGNENEHLVGVDTTDFPLFSTYIQEFLQDNDGDGDIDGWQPADS